ncbi:MAG TPA: PorV/PorQ family protein [Bacteroidota bacterium]|nr:PorV/PorQ family protein [Bacteroidota bacterium]
MKKDCLKVLGILLLASAVCVAGDDSKTGTAGAEELLLPVGGRSIALAGANLANVDGIEAVFWNPAGVAIMQGDGEATFSHMNYFADIGLEYGSIGFKAEGIGTFALSVKSLDFGDIQQTTEDQPEGTGVTFSPTFAVFGLTFARELTDRISVGVTAKYISEKIINTSANGFGFDMGVKYKFGPNTPLNGLKFAVAVKNLGPQMQYDGTDLDQEVVPPNSAANAQEEPLRFTTLAFELPSTIELGLAYDYMISPDNRFSIAGVFQNSNFGSDQYRIGGEYAFNEIFFLRGGYTYAPLEGSSTNSTIFGLCAGAGAAIDLGGVQARLDYAYEQTKYFVGTNTISVTLGF